MDPLTIHLRVNHLPIMATLLALPILFAVLFRKEPRDLLLAASIVLTIGLGGALVALRSGEGAEDLVQASEALVEEHEERAEPAAVATGIAAAISWLAFGITFRRRPPIALSGAALAATVIAAGLMAWTAEAGGKIGHPELRNGAPPPAEAEEHEPET